MKSNSFTYPKIKVVAGDKVSVSFYANKTGEISLSFESSEYPTKDSDLGFVIFKF